MTPDLLYNPAFEDAIRECPEDAERRLKYADWCLEQGGQEEYDLLTDPDFKHHASCWAKVPAAMLGRQTLLDYLRMIKSILTMDITTVKWEEQSGLSKTFRTYIVPEPKTPSDILHGTV